MLRRQFASSSSSLCRSSTIINHHHHHSHASCNSFLNKFASTTMTAASITSSFRFKSSASDEKVSPEELANRARLEKLAKARLAEAGGAPRSIERGAPEDKNSQPPPPSYDSAGSMKMSRRGNSNNNSKHPAAAAAAAKEASFSNMKVERTRDTNPEPQDVKGKAPPSSSKVASTPESKSETKKQAAVDNSNDSKSTDKQETASTSTSAKKQPVEGSPLSASGGSKIVFDVPEGELPQQASYDPWAILGLKPGASSHDLRVRYHELLEQYHPEYVRDGGSGDVQKWAEVDRAYQLVTKAPSHDKRFRNLISDTQNVYYKLLPMWMARNIDEMPRWWSWARWKLPTPWFIAAMLALVWVIGKIYAYYPRMGVSAMICFVCDILFHTSSFPIMVGVMLTTLMFSGGNKDMAWLTSPKGFLRRPLQY